jgi:hypothetical protein
LQLFGNRTVGLDGYNDLPKLMFVRMQDKLLELTLRTAALQPGNQMHH